MPKKPAKPAKPASPAKKVAPIKATAGTGFPIEDKVAAVGAAAILLGSSPFPEFPGKLVRIGFQVRPAHWHFEDVLFSLERDAGNYQAGVSIRSNQQISSVALSRDVKDALAAQFLQPDPNPFRPGLDRLALVSDRHDAEVTAAVRGRLLEIRGFERGSLLCLGIHAVIRVSSASSLGESVTCFHGW